MLGLVLKLLGLILVLTVLRLEVMLQLMGKIQIVLLLAPLLDAQIKNIRQLLLGITQDLLVNAHWLLQLVNLLAKHPKGKVLLHLVKQQEGLIKALTQLRLVKMQDTQVNQAKQSL